MTNPRGATRREALKHFQQPVDTTDSSNTIVLDGTADKTVAIVDLAIDAQKVSFQASGTLAGTVEFSINGIDYTNPTAIGAANAIITFSDHMVSSLRVTRTGGTGYLAILAS